MNAFEGLALFAPLAIAVALTGASSAITVTASATYFWARLVYAPLYYFDVPVLKTAAWMVGLIATLVLAFGIIR